MYIRCPGNAALTGESCYRPSCELPPSYRYEDTWFWDETVRCPARRVLPRFLHKSLSEEVKWRKVDIYGELHQEQERATTCWGWVPYNDWWSAGVANSGACYYVAIESSTDEGSVEASWRKAARRIKSFGTTRWVQWFAEELFLWVINHFWGKAVCRFDYSDKSEKVDASYLHWP